MDDTVKKLSEEEKATYEWQMWTDGVGQSGQEKLKNSTVFVSRCGGLGSVVAYELAAAGVGKLILAHAGNIKHSDLNRQLLMTYDGLGKPRIESAQRRLQELNPNIEIIGLNSNVDNDLADEWMPKVDVCVGAAPLFEERFAMSSACVKHRKPFVDCAMFDMEASITTYPAGGKPCLKCTTPEKPEYWKREFPVFGATSGTVACMGAIEAIKLITGVGSTLENRMLRINLKDMSFHEFSLNHIKHCAVCS